MKTRFRMISILLVLALCGIAMVPGVAAYPKYGPWLDNASVLANTSYFATINGTVYQNNNFFALIYNSHWNITSQYYTYLAWNYTVDPQYNNVYHVTQLRDGLYWYPNWTFEQANPNWAWVITTGLDINATNSYDDAYDCPGIGNGLAGWVNGSGTYYLWYGNVTAATYYWNKNYGRLIPSVQNATYLVGINVTCNDASNCGST